MSLFNFLSSAITSLTIEKVVRFTARRSADLIYFSIPVFSDPKITTMVIVTHRVTKVVAKKYKRTNYDAQQIFEDSIDAISEAY
jgi:hypothetical protein